MGGMLEPTVSVIIPAYNVRKCIARAIESAYEQEGVSIEVIVIDDASTDGTAEFVAERFSNYPDFHLVRLSKNGGPAAARNRGLREARGAWVALLDADDWWRPERLKTLVREGEGFDFVADNIMGFDVGAGRETWPIYPLGNNHELRLSDFLVPVASANHDFGYLQPMMRRAFLDANRLAYREDVRSGEDLLFYLQFLIKGGRALFVNRPLYVYALPVGPISRKASPFSRTPGKNQRLIEALASFRDTYRGRLTSVELSALTRRIDRFRDDAPIAEFHHAKARFDILSMLRLALFNRQVQSNILNRVLARIPNPFVLPMMFLLSNVEPLLG